jgi:hypothetical protein
MDHHRQRKRYLRLRRQAKACHRERLEWTGKASKQGRALSREEVARIAAERGWSVADKPPQDHA